jgi:hypothetical protein
MPISISQYLEYYTVGENFTKLQFIKSHYKQKKKDQDKTIIYHNGKLDNIPKICGYFLPRRMEGGK